jgi:periplasmic protein TonB
MRALLCAVVIFVAPVLWAQSPNATPSSISAPRPYYSDDWARRGLFGEGVAEVKLSKSGRVIAARMLKSTGHNELDDSALNAFRKWHFKPGTKSPVRIPIEFTNKVPAWLKGT